MESTKIEILEKVLQKIEDQLTRWIQIKSESSDKFDKALSYCYIHIYLQIKNIKY